MCIICAPGAWNRLGAKPAQSRFVATAVEAPTPGETDCGPADTILCGTIVTMDEAAPHAEAVAVRDGRILAVGTRDAVAGRRGRRTRMIALDGRALLPGFIDAHWQMPGASDPDSADAVLRAAFAEAAANGFTALRACNLASLSGYSALAAMRAVMDDAPPVRFLTKQTAAQPSVRPDRTTLCRVTIEAARACGIDALTGSITAGKSADFAIVALDPAHGDDAPLTVLATWLQGREIYRA